MKLFRLVATLITSTVLLFALALLPQKPTFSGAESYRIFVGDSSKNCKEITTAHPAVYKAFLKNVSGESAVYSSLDLNTFLSDNHAEIIFTEELSDSVNYYCKAPMPYSVWLYGEEINLHICVKADCTVVGSPIIFGGY